MHFKLMSCLLLAILKNKRLILDKSTCNSLLLSVYMQIIFFYYLFSSLRLILFGIMFLISFGVLYRIKSSHVVRRNEILVFCYFLFSLCIQVINLSLSHFLIFLVAGPILGYWIFISIFNIRILKISFLFTFTVLSFFYIRHHSFAGIFAGLSENYVSILMICNTVLIAGIELKQGKTFSLFPAIGGLILSVLSWGRSGILCSGMLFLLILYMYISCFPLKIRNIIWSLISIFLILIVLVTYDYIVDFVENAEVLSKFQERGLKSPSRGILLDEYFRHIDVITLLLGYKFDNNSWFIHYGLNPHNSYIRLHYQIGFMGILFFAYLLMKLFNLLRRNFIAFMMLGILMIRAFTDVYLFFGMYDFLIFFLLMFAANTNDLYAMNHR